MVQVRRHSGLSQKKNYDHKQRLGSTILHSYNYLNLKTIMFGLIWQTDQGTQNVHWTFDSTIIITTNHNCWCL